MNRHVSDILYGMYRWEFNDSSSRPLISYSIPIHNDQFLHSLHNKDNVEVPIPILGNTMRILSESIIDGVSIINFTRGNEIYRFLKNYKKLIETFFINNDVLRFYNARHIPEKYFIGRGILTDENGNILCLITREFKKANISEGTIYQSDPLLDDQTKSLVFYISPKLINSPKNALEKAFVKHIYNHILSLNSNKIVIHPNINSLFIADKNTIEHRGELKERLFTINNHIDSFLNQLHNES